ncbi:MAG: hypothetical protein JNM67_02085 [Bacteroidetes bacterium]|nr:hypothetical protein [Bacteroidota bacterium]
MKILLLALMLLPTRLFSQKFTLNELTFLHSADWITFDSFVTSRGYSLENKNTTAITGNRIVIHANSNKRIDSVKSYKYSRNGGKTDYYISKTNYDYSNNPEVKIIFKTKESKDYNEIKKAIKKTGFKYLNSESHVEKNRIEKLRFFRKGNHTVSLVIGQLTENNVVVKKSYFFEVHIFNR